ncbi:expressed hypothetical protein [Trichoplax adhaerens]|uniref:RRM domain-containing protein n=1 Tax=Trichoplax adhaerens TaxID=10228 RepID=B3S183_TRIAD|nr:expressed hypothetical protein [Trichoplax adhaerens]EDV23518.1 expressed hypothetical protein [Trichoplax adhaerens]|eukprot:XP_002114428.1 expressed hypothetical protein [Trichoplax adhaerens]
MADRTRVYIGNLGSGAAKHEIEKEFARYGPLKDVWIARNPPGFAFVVFDDPLDAQDAVEALDGRRLCGARVRVEIARGDSHPSVKRSTGHRDRGGYGGNRNEPDRYSSRRSRSFSKEKYDKPPRRRSGSRDRFDDRRDRGAVRRSLSPYRERVEPDYRNRRSRSKERYQRRRSVSPSRPKYETNRYDTGDGRHDSPSRGKYMSRHRSRSRSRSPMSRRRRIEEGDARYKSPRENRGSPGHSQERRDY